MNDGFYAVMACVVFTAWSSLNRRMEYIKPQKSNATEEGQPKQSSGQPEHCSG